MNKDIEILIQSIDYFLAHPDEMKVTINDDTIYIQKGMMQGIESANLVRDGKIVVFQEFRQGGVTITDKDPDWKETLRKAVADSKWPR